MDEFQHPIINHRLYKREYLETLLAGGRVSSIVLKAALIWCDCSESFIRGGIIDFCDHEDSQCVEKPDGAIRLCFRCGWSASCEDYDG